VLGASRVLRPDQNMNKARKAATTREGMSRIVVSCGLSEGRSPPGRLEAPTFGKRAVRDRTTPGTAPRGVRSAGGEQKRARGRSSASALNNRVGETTPAVGVVSGSVQPARRRACPEVVREARFLQMWPYPPGGARAPTLGAHLVSRPEAVSVSEVRTRPTPVETLDDGRRRRTLAGAQPHPCTRHATRPGRRTVG
jgi:hypothetical protein